MKVLNPNNSDHEIKLIYRRGLSGNVVFTLTNEVSKDSEILTIDSASTLDGVTTIQFNKTVSDRDRYTIKANDDSGVVYRCKVFVTDQTVQDYSKTKGYIEYE